jgi:hypothetical protein
VTIGIGVLCSTMPKPHVPQPDAMILISDIIESIDSDSENELRKMYIYPDEKLFCVCVGRFDKSGDLLPAIQREFQELTMRNQATFTEALNRVVYNHRAQHFHFDVLPNYYFATEDIPPDQHQNVTDAWQRYDVGVHVLVGTFDEHGQALMYVIAQIEGFDGWVHRALFPGVATIGLGAHSARAWLDYRRQVPSRSVRQSAYQAYEARRILAKTPSVNANLEMLFATNERVFHLDGETPEIEGCPFSLPELEKMFKKYGPRDTSQDLGHSGSLNAVA